MSDIEERLRDATDELRTLHAHLRHRSDVNAELRAEVERLEAALHEIASDGKCRNLQDAVERARAALEGDEALFPTKKICPECGQPMREGGYCNHIPF